MQNYTLGNSYKHLLSHADLIATASDLPWAVIKEAYSGIKNYPLSASQQKYLQDRLLDCEPARLWRINRPSILIYRFPNNELRFFLLSQTANICEHVINRAWYKYFPFLRESGESVYIDHGSCPSIHIDSEVAWLPQNYNYSHLLCDFLSPWISFADIVQLPEALPVLSIDPWKPWQNELIRRIGLKEIDLPDCQPCSLLIVRPRAVWLPVQLSTLISQYNLRAWLSSEYSISGSQCSSQDIPVIYLAREDKRSARVRNANEIKQLVARCNGLIIDPAALTYSEKICLFGKARAIICEGSGSLNAVLFTSENCRVILLTDPMTLTNPLFLDGGFPYLHLISHRSEFIIGESPKALVGSPLFSCEFNLEQISRHVISAQHKQDGICGYPS